MIYDNTYIKPYDECIECLTKEFVIEQLNKLTDTSKDLIASKIVELDASNYYKSTYIDILHQRIDKAIEYIDTLEIEEDDNLQYGSYSIYEKDNYNKCFSIDEMLLKIKDILKGDNNE